MSNKPQIYDLGDFKAIVLPYDGFAKLGVETIPALPAIAVPLFDNVEQAVAAANDVVAPLEAQIAAMGVRKLIELGIRSGALSWLAGAPPAYAEKLFFPYTLFRGESRNEYGIIPTIFRSFPADGDERVISRRRRVERRNARIMQTALLGRTWRRPSLEQARAAARHYGSPSSLVDFSFSPNVSGYFGHPRLSQAERKNESTRPIGIIYCLRFEHLAQIFGLQGFNNDPQGGIEITFYIVQRTWEIPYMSFDPKQKSLLGATLTFRVPDELVNTKVKIRCIPVIGVRRIAAQQGIFVEIALPHSNYWFLEALLWYLIDFATEKWCFFRDDYDYTDPTQGITEGDLLPADGLLMKLASRLISRR
ncbi:MAG TPA: FRG domain-containing protein [Pyrinomonadaceae bacterium]|nr:FRG domain-containing protein [Pyrinomonadaceae bacterium]